MPDTVKPVTLRCISINEHIDTGHSYAPNRVAGTLVTRLREAETKGIGTVGLLNEAATMLAGLLTLPDRTSDMVSLWTQITDLQVQVQNINQQLGEAIQDDNAAEAAIAQLRIDLNNSNTINLALAQRPPPAPSIRKTKSCQIQRNSTVQRRSSAPS